MKFTAVVAASIAFFSSANFALAEDPPAAPAVAACVSQASLDENATSLKADPVAFISQFAEGGGGLIRAVRAVLVNDPSTANVVVKSLGGTSDKQAFSIGVGMGQAAAACSKGNPDAAASIQLAVASSGNPSALAGFSQAFGNLLVASLGGGNAGSGAGLPSGSSSALGTGFDGGGSGGTGNTGTPTDSTVSAANSSGNFMTGTTAGSTRTRINNLFAAVSPITP